MSAEIKPNMIIVGAMKASTSLLYETLSRHPDVWLPELKEPQYFSHHSWDKPGAWEEYLKLFEPCPADKKIVGEASTGYSKLPRLGPTPQRIREKLGQPKLMYIIRDPVARCVSNFRHSYMRGFFKTGTTFGEGLREDPMLACGSTYAFQIREYRKEFGQDGLFIVVAEELYKKPAKVMSEVERYLELRPYDGWDQPLPEINSAQQVKADIAWDKMLGQTWRRRIARATPQWAKDLADKVFVPPVREAPPITKEDEEICFEMLKDDLRDLLTLIDPERIAIWPSVKKLQSASNHAPEPAPVS